MMTQEYERISRKNNSNNPKLAAERRFGFDYYYPGVRRVTRTRLKKTDSRSLVVKTLGNPKGFPAFCASIEPKSALFKIYDLKARRFRGILV